MVDPSLLPELPHGSVNPRVARAALLPHLEHQWITLPRHLEADWVVLSHVKVWYLKEQEGGKEEGREEGREIGRASCRERV